MDAPAQACAKADGQDVQPGFDARQFVAQLAGGRAGGGLGAVQIVGQVAEQGARLVAGGLADQRIQVGEGVEQKMWLYLGLQRVQLGQGLPALRRLGAGARFQQAAALP